MNKAQYIEQIAAATCIEHIVVLTNKIDTDGEISNTEATSLVDVLSDRLLEVI
jgi:hypothetical protein